MMKQKDTSNNGITKLFVAGVPSGVNSQAVLEFFRQYGHFDLCPSSVSPLGSGKGYCNLLSYDSEETNRVVDQRFFKFMERTLTVTRHKSGLGLIVHNKRINKCRVIFKKVPPHYTEERFRQELTTLCGEVESLFQFKPVVPSSSCYKLHSYPSRSSVFSVVFKSKQVAQKLVKLGSLTLMDDSVVKTESFLKGKKQETLPHSASSLTNKRNFPKEKTSKLLKKSSLETGNTSEPLFPKQNLKKSIAVFSYQTKPCSSAYEAARRMQLIRNSDIYFNFRTFYRLNVEVSNDTSRRTCLETSHGTIMIRSY